MNTNAILAPEVFLLQIANPAFPTGAFNHSYGFETWIDSNQLSDAASTEAALTDWLTHGLTPTDGAITAHAFRAASARDMTTLADLDALSGAIKLTREIRAASLKTGQALLNALDGTMELPQLRRIAESVAGNRMDGHHCIVFAVAAEAFGLDISATVRAYLHTSLANLVQVAARLVPLGQIDAQRILARAWTQVGDEAERAIAMPVEVIGGRTAALDIASMQHERLHTRLCVS